MKMAIYRGYIIQANEVSNTEENTQVHNETFLSSTTPTVLEV